MAGAGVIHRLVGHPPDTAHQTALDRCVQWMTRNTSSTRAHIGVNRSLRWGLTGARRCPRVPRNHVTKPTILPRTPPQLCPMPTRRRTRRMVSGRCQNRSGRGRVWRTYWPPTSRKIITTIMWASTRRQNMQGNPAPCEQLRPATCTRKPMAAGTAGLRNLPSKHTAASHNLISRVDTELAHNTTDLRRRLPTFYQSHALRPMGIVYPRSRAFL